MIFRLKKLADGLEKQAERNANARQAAGAASLAETNAKLGELQRKLNRAPAQAAREAEAAAPTPGPAGPELPALAGVTARSRNLDSKLYPCRNLGGRGIGTAVVVEDLARLGRGRGPRGHADLAVVECVAGDFPLAAAAGGIAAEKIPTLAWWRT